MSLYTDLTTAGFTSSEANSLVANFDFSAYYSMNLANLNITATRTDTVSEGVSPDWSTCYFAPTSTSGSIVFSKVGYIEHTGSATLTGHYGGILGWAKSNASQTTPFILGVEGKITSSGGNITNAYALQGQLASNTNGITISTLICGDFVAYDNAGTISTMAGTKISVNNNTGSIGTYYGHFVDNPGGNTTNSYSFYANDCAASTLNIGFYGGLAAGSGKYNIYMGGTAPNVLAGKLYLAQDSLVVQNTAGLFAGSGAPNNNNGSNGDFYFRGDTPGTANQRIYTKSAGAWIALL